MRYSLICFAFFFLCNVALIEVNQAKEADPPFWAVLGFPKQPWKIIRRDPFNNSKDKPVTEADYDLRRCLSFLSLNKTNCGAVTISHLLLDRPFKDPCCNLVIGMGWFCHESLFATVVKDPDFKTFDTKKVWKRKDDLWNHCVERGKRWGRAQLPKKAPGGQTRKA